MNLELGQPNQMSSSHSPNQQWQFFCSELKKTMSGSDEQKDHILRRRILKFFHNFSLDKNRYYVSRREALVENSTPLQFSNNSILLYGIDFLPLSKIQQYFYPFQVSIQYYDDSHCSVTFENYQNLIKAIYPRLQNSIYKNIEQFNECISSSQQNKLQWRQLMSYYQLCFERQVWFRLLTSTDYHNKNLLGQQTIYKTYLVAKDAFFKDIQKIKEAGLSNMPTRNRQHSTQYSRQRSFSRSRSKERSKNSKIYQQPSKRESRDKYGNLSHQCKQCNCNVFKQVKRIVDQAEGKICSKVINTPKKQYEQFDEQLENNNTFNKKQTVSMKKIRYQQKKLTSKPRVSRRVSQKQSNHKPHHRLEKTLECSKPLNIDLNEELTINSLARDLQRYKFDDQSSQFGKYMAQVQSQGQRLLASTKYQAEQNINSDEYSFFEMIEQQ